MDQIDRASAVEQAMPGIEPDARFLRIIEFRQSIDDIAQVGDQKLGFGMWKGRARGPAGYGGRRHSRDIRDVAALEAATLPEIVDQISNCTCHDECPDRAEGFRFLSGARHLINIFIS